VTWIPEGFPPLVIHHLHLAAVDAAEWPVGARRVVASRVIEGDGVGSSSSLEPDLDRDTLRLRWIACRATVPSEVRPETEANLRWVGDQPYVREVVARRDVIVRAWWTLVGRLVRAGALSPAEARTLEPRVVLEVVDHRTWRRRDLPQVPETLVPNPWRRRGRPVRPR
jgi:hypothetical protein